VLSICFKIYLENWRFCLFQRVGILVIMNIEKVYSGGYLVYTAVAAQGDIRIWNAAYYFWFQYC